ncbi:MAG: hypothetical protein V2A74_00530, partial [bacterium]
MPSGIYRPYQLLAAALWCFVVLEVAAQGGLNPPLRFALKNETNAAWNAQPITSGVTLPQGAVTDVGQLVFREPGGAETPTQFLRTARWPNGTIKWVLLDFQASLPPGATRQYELRSGLPTTSTTTLSLLEGPSSLTVQSGAQMFVFNRNELRILGREFRVTMGGNEFRAVPFAAPEPEAFPSPALPWQVEECGPLKLVLRSEGEFRGVANSFQRVGPYLRYRARLYFFAGQSSMRAYVTLRNNQSYDWADEDPAAPLPDVSFSAIRLGALELVAPGTTNLFGPGLEKTWEVELSLDGAQARQIVVRVD